MYASLDSGITLYDEEAEGRLPVCGLPRPDPASVPLDYEKVNGCVYIKKWSHEQAPSSLAMVCCHYGGYHALRKDATLRALRRMDEFEVKPAEAVFIELVCPGQQPCFSREDMSSWIQYVRVSGKERNDGIFQKEALWNIGARLTSADSILFLDGDCMPLEDTYFKDILDASGKGKCVHAAWHIIHEGQPEGHRDFYSFFADKRDVPKKCVRFPGMGYCLHRDDYERMGGFNPHSICGSGDAIFLWECLKSVNQPMTYAKRFHTLLMRPDRPQLIPVAVKGMTVQHNYHGMKTERGYVWSRYLVELFGDPRSYTHIDPSGLIAWNDPEFPLRYMLMKKDRMHTKAQLHALLCETFKERLDAIERRSLSGPFEGTYNTMEYN